MIKVVSNRGFWSWVLAWHDGLDDGRDHPRHAEKGPQPVADLGISGKPARRRRLARKIKGPAAVRATHENVSQTMIQPAGESPLQMTRSM